MLQSGAVVCLKDSPRCSIVPTPFEVGHPVSSSLRCDAQAGPTRICKCRLWDRCRERNISVLRSSQRRFSSAHLDLKTDLVTSTFQHGFVNPGFLRRIGLQPSLPLGVDPVRGRKRSQFNRSANAIWRPILHADLRGRHGRIAATSCQPDCHNGSNSSH